MERDSHQLPPPTPRIGAAFGVARKLGLFLPPQTVDRPHDAAIMPDVVPILDLPNMGKAGSSKSKLPGDNRWVTPGSVPCAE